MNTDENKKKIIMLFIIFGIVITIITGVTFSYLAPTINNVENESTVAFNAGVIAIDFDDKSSQIVASDILPGWSETKKFSLIATNTTSIRKADAMNYSLKLVVESNTFSDNAIAVSLKSTNTSNNGTIAEIIPGTLLSGASEVSLGYGTFDATQEIGEAGATHDFELTVSFPEQYRSQSNDMGKHLSAHVTIGRANDLGTLTIADSYEKTNVTTNVEKNKEVTLLSLYTYPVDRYFSIVSGEGTINANKLTLKSDEMKVSINYPSITNTISSLDKSENGLEVDDTTDKNLRYVGATPKNYITFNGETWRIIGIFNVYNTETGKYEKLTKIIRNESIGNYSWDTSVSTINDGYGINEWSQADLMTELNTDYLDTSKTSETTTWYNGNNNNKTATYDYSKNIKSTSIEQIATVRWNLGGYSTYQVSALNMYNYERGTAHINNPSDGVTRTNTWDGKIALMYPSDYGYASTDVLCKNNLYQCSNSNDKMSNWLMSDAHQWVLSSFSTSVRRMFVIQSKGNIYDNYASDSAAVRPALFLKSDVVITGGTGDEKDPYTISNYNAFRDDSWTTIADNVKNGNTSLYNVGDTKKITVDGTSYTVRLANNSTPSECSGTVFSQTACGFVIEFVDIIEEEYMGQTSWETSIPRSYLNGSFYNNLPSELKSIITSTKVISGKYSTGVNETTDKLYLLSPREVWGNITTGDTSYNNSRQLDYYKNLGVTTTNYENAIKKYNGSNSSWWLRSAYNSSYTLALLSDIIAAPSGCDYFVVTSNGNYGNDFSETAQLGISPAFRIG